jgi:hypothetical protein
VRSISLFFSPDTFFTPSNLYIMVQFIRGFAVIYKTPIVLSLVFFAFFLLRPVQVWTSSPAQTPPPANSSTQPVVVELFTSEGCSSCPPADELVKKLDDSGRVADVEILALEEHVDYWDHLGWRDPFSSYLWTERQERYAKALSLNGVYTPQIVVNGNRELVGGSGQKAFETIIEAAKAPAAKIRLSPGESASKSMQFTIAVDNAPTEVSGADLWLAVTERGLSSHVLSGENEGRNLAHGPILRALTRVRAPRADASGSVTTEATVRLDPSWRRENLRFVVFLQDKKSLHILGAAAASALR